MFLPRAKFKSDAHFTHAYVVYPKQLKQVLGQHGTSVIDRETKQLLTQKLETALVKDKQQEKEMKKRHVQTIRTKQKQTEQHIQQNRCPKCGGVLIIRKGKYGTFKGCSNYPNASLRSRLGELVTWCPGSNDRVQKILNQY